MKKLLFVLLLFSISVASITPVASIAQVSLTVSHTPLTNGDTSYLTYRIPSTYSSLAFSAVVTKTSGTVAGTAIPQASIDGVLYQDISKDTLTFSNKAINYKSWTFDKSYYLYYRVMVITTGSQVSVPTGKLLGRF